MSVEEKNGEIPVSKKNADIIFDGPVTEGKLRARVWRLAWPTIGEQCLNLLVGLSDVFFVGHLSLEASAKLGYGVKEALSAAALGNFFNWLALVIFSSLSIPATALIARAYGQGERQKAANIGRQAMVLALILGLITGVLIHFLAADLIRSFGASEKVVEIGTVYLQTTSYGMVFWALMIVGSACLRGSGDTRTPLLVVTLVNGVNILVGASLVNGAFGLPTLGVGGAAIGAATAWTVGGLVVMARLFGWFGKRRLGSPNQPLYLEMKWKLERSVIKSLSKIGLPTFGEQIAFQIGIFFFARLVVGLGEADYAAYNAIITIDSIAFLPGIGFGIANTILVGQCLGARRPDLAERYAMTAYKMGLLFMTVMGLTFIFFPEFFLGLLVSDPTVIKTAADPLRFAGAFDPLLATVFIFIGALRGAGDTRFPMYGRMVATWGVRFLLGYLFIEIASFGLIGARLAMGLDSLVLAIMVYWRFKSGRWKTILKAEPKPVEMGVVPLQAAPAPSDE